MNDRDREHLSVLVGALDDLYECLGELRLAIDELRERVALIEADNVTETPAIEWEELPY